MNNRLARVASEAKAAESFALSVPIEWFFALRDLARLMLVGAWGLTFCTFVPIFVGAAVTGQSEWLAPCVAAALVAWVGIAVWIMRIRSFGQTERTMRSLARRSGGVVDLAEFARVSRLSAGHARYVADALVADGVVELDSMSAWGAPRFRFIEPKK